MESEQHPNIVNKSKNTRSGSRTKSKRAWGRLFKKQILRRVHALKPILRRGDERDYFGNSFNAL